MSERNNKKYLLILFVVSVVAYLNTLPNSFVYDDLEQVVANPWLRDARFIPDIIFSSVWSFKAGVGQDNIYRPMMHLIFMGEYQLFGPSSWGFHLVNTLLHAVNALLVFLFASVIFKPGMKCEGAQPVPGWVPFVAALVFALHPVNSEAVSWVSAMPDLAYTFFILLALLIYTGGAGQGASAPSKGRAIIAACFFFLSLTTKEMAYLFIPMVVLFDCFGGKERLKAAFVNYIIFVATIVGYIVLRLYALGEVVQQSSAPTAFSDKLLKLFPIIYAYFAELFLPIKLSIAQPARSAASFGEVLVIAGVVIAILFIAALYLARRNKVFVTALFLIALPILPTLVLAAVAHGGLADRYLYLSTAGFGMALSYLLWRLSLSSENIRKIVPIFFVLLFLLYGVGTVKRTFVWRDGMTLWSDAVIKDPNNSGARNSLALEYFDRGEMETALTHFRKAVELDPKNHNAHFNLALLYGAVNDTPRSILHYRKAIDVYPAHYQAHYNLAMAYISVGDRLKAIEHLKSAIRIYSRSADIHFNLAWIYRQGGDLDGALTHFLEAARLQPGSADTHYNLGLVYMGKGLFKEAVRELEVSLAIEPANGQARGALKRAKALVGTRGAPVSR